MKYLKYFFVLAAACVLTGYPTAAHAAVYQVDKDHTVVSFKIRNFVSVTQGFFRDFQGTVNYVPGKPDDWTSEGTIKVQSIDTNDSPRDRHLLSKDFFDNAKFPAISFRTTQASAAADNSAQVRGLIKIRDIEKPLTLDVRNIVLAKDGKGIEHLKFTATAKIDRRDFGMTYSSAGPGNMMLGNDVNITIQVEAARK